MNEAEGQKWNALKDRIEELEKVVAAVWGLEREYHTQEGDSCSWDREPWPCPYAALGAALEVKA